jgi:glycerol-3-phosphate O-acyltransferase
MCPVAINGEVLHVRQGDMLEDSLSKDVVRITAGQVLSCAEFRDRVRAAAEEQAAKTTGEAEDKKQAVADAIMALLEEMHNQAEQKRKKLLK